MSEHRDYADITPVDLRNPFCNPTEEMGYSPDYRDIVPELDWQESKLNLYPTPPERKMLRRKWSMVILSLLFAFFTSWTVYTSLRLVVEAILRQVDLRAVETLPENYTEIVGQFLADSSLELALRVIAFLIGNLVAFFVGCRLTEIKPATLFQIRELTATKTIRYIAVGIWIQLVTCYLNQWLALLLGRMHIQLAEPVFQIGGSTLRTLMLVTYTVLVIPITEELLLRGVVLKNLSRVSQRYGIIVTAFLFAVMYENIPQFIGMFPLGILLGVITIRHHSVTPAIIVHMSYSLCGLLQQYAEGMLSVSLYRKVALVYTLAVILLGTAAVVYTDISDRMPLENPHQTLRVRGLLVTSPLFWIFLSLHIAAGIFIQKIMY